jgi:replicative DNA helicase
MSENIILTNLIYNQSYIKKVLPFLKTEYFQEQRDKVIFSIINKYYIEYNKSPTIEAIQYEMGELPNITDELFSHINDYIASFDSKTEQDEKWLISITEQFCQDRAIHNALINSISIIDGSDKKLTKHAIPDLLKSALSVSFNTQIGHDYFEDAEKRFEFYSLEEYKVPFKINILNKVTNGGVSNKTLNLIIGSTNIGKTMVLVNFAADYLVSGKNVLYITLEMSEEAISNRIDANLLGVNVNDVEALGKDKFMSKIKKIQSKTNGKLIVREYPTSNAHVGHFRVLLQELKIKKNFVPDVILIDYINIMSSSRVKLANTNSHFYIKAIAEEIRGLSVEYDIPIWSATQTNRQGYDNTEVDMSNTAESYGINSTVDFLIAIVRTEELDKLSQLMIKQLKSRYGNKNMNERFVVGVDVNKMKIFDVESTAQTLVNSVATNLPVTKHTNKLKF